MKLTKREIWCLKYLLSFDIRRYMMCNAKGREDGFEKAGLHISISQTLAMFILCEGMIRHEDTENVNSCTMPIHDYLAEILTDRMDEVIGYPVDKVMYAEDFDYYAEKFFKVILNHISEIKKIVENILAKQ